jgi:aspartyl-tRNA(Asn)/glutamyl-tRNA(Gln) amidotransferase subunit B
MDYLITIGLEIHLKLNSQTKIFCRCKNEQDFNTPSNTNICPVCTGQPGALPLLSKEVVDKAILFGHALNADIQPVSSFDRKNYFYPDLPMGFQITQFYHPIIQNGEVNYRINNYEEEKAVHIHEAHLECDTAKMIHENGKSLLDFNRAGTPLLEIVTDPDFTSAEEAVEYTKEIQRIARRNGLGDADLEKGQMRVDVNISIRKNASDPLNKKVEMKNINSF